MSALSVDGCGDSAIVNRGGRAPIFSSGVVIDPANHTSIDCIECGGELVNVTRYPGPLMYRCMNRSCGQCALPKVA